MRTVNIVKNEVVTNSNVVANVSHAHYHNGSKYIPCILGGHWVNVRATNVVFQPKANPFSVL